MLPLITLRLQNQLLVQPPFDAPQQVVEWMGAVQAQDYRMAPIAGDRLYGTAGRRLLLHAERIEFRHPATGDRIAIEKPADF